MHRLSEQEKVYNETGINSRGHGDMPEQRRFANRVFFKAALSRLV